MDKCTGCRDITRIILKTVLNTMQPINVLTNATCNILFKAQAAFSNNNLFRNVRVLYDLQ